MDWCNNTATTLFSQRVWATDEASMPVPLPLPDCLVRIGTSPVVLASLPLLVLVLFVVIPALRAMIASMFSASSLSASACEMAEREPLLSNSSSDPNFTFRPSEQWQLADQEEDATPPPLSRFYCLRFFGHMVSVLLVVLAGQWELVKELSDADDHFGDTMASMLLLLQMALALILFVSYAKIELKNTNNSDVFIELQKRRNRKILFRLAIFHVLSASMWTFVIIAAWPLWQAGKVSNYFLGLSIGMYSGGFVMAGVCILMHNLIKTRRIHRLKVNGKIPSPELDATILSWLTFSWFDPMMSYGYKHTLKFDDLWDINPSESMETNLSRYAYIQRRKPTPLLLALWKMNWVYMSQQFGLVLLSTSLYFAGPFFLNRILNHLTNRGVQGKEEPEWLAYMYVCGILVTSVSRFCLEGQVSLTARKLGMRIRNTLSGLIYRKSLRRIPKLAMDDDRGLKKETNDTSDNAGASVGKIVNLMSVDAGNVGEWSGTLYTPLITLIEIVLCVLSLIYVLGWPAIAGVVLMVLLLFSGAPLANTIKNVNYTVKRNRDTRVNSMNELLQGIKIIKLFAWEKKFEERVTKFRETELDSFFKIILLYSFNRVLWYSAPILTTFVTLGTYTKVAGFDLDATTAFTALALFNLLRGPLQTFPDTLVNLLDVWVSIKRIKVFLNEEDLERFGENEALSTDVNELSLSHASFEWPDKEKSQAAQQKSVGSFFQRLFGRRAHNSSDGTAASGEPTDTPFQLVDMNVQFPQNQLTVVFGATGSGKTSLVLSLLGETRRLSGNRSCPDSVAYVSQTAWLTNATIRENILFGTPWDPVRYRRVIQACALVKDFEVLDGGDSTEVGEKGINLSGGQKQRISLARAAYSRSQFVILDDPLSAVDAPTAAHLFKKCILGLLANRTRVLVTNAVGLAIPSADHLVLINAGRISIQGPVETVLSAISASNTEFAVTAFSDGLADMSDLVLSERRKFLAEKSATNPTEFLESLDADTTAPVYLLEKTEGGTKLTEDEKMESGNVKLKVYGLYLQAMGGTPFFVILLVGYCLNHALAIGQDVVVSWWTSQYPSNTTRMGMGNFGSVPPNFDAAPVQQFPFISSSWFRDGAVPGHDQSITDKYLTMYGIVGGLCMISIFTRLMILNVGIVRAARAIHSAMLKKILRAPLRFFEVTPLGRVMNRFTKDLSSVDWEVGNSTASLVYFIVQTAFVVATVSAVTPALFLFLIPIGYFYVRIGLYYIRTSRSLKRIDSVARSPIFSHFSETLTGVTTIRAFNDLDRFTEESSRRFNVSNRATYFLSVSNLWLSIRIQSLGTVIVFCAGILIVATGVGPGLAGLCLNFTLTLTDTLIALVRVQSWMEMSMNSIERCDEYINLEEEAADVVAEKKPPADWPSSGQISIQNLEMRYSPDSPTVLHGISAEIQAKEKVGIVGRTGAGKSSLTLAMFRIVEPSGGKIWIDNVDISELGLDDLRSRLTIIPQDPVLFAGTVRSNLDPFGSIPDADLWAALKRAHLVPSHSDHQRATSSASVNTIVVVEDESTAMNTQNGLKKEKENEFALTLDSPISESGNNLSSGQRQMLCLARALANCSRVIMLDEATASVDTETDGRIQATIRTEFEGSTLLVIAHRIRTIIDYDRILVLDQGRIVENGSPIELIEKGGLFRKMCEETGEFEELMTLAKKT